MSDVTFPAWLAMVAVTIAAVWVSWRWVAVGAVLALAVFWLAALLHRSRLRTVEWLLLTLLHDPGGHYADDLARSGQVPVWQVEQGLQYLAGHGVVTCTDDAVWRLIPPDVQ